jgi:hypothetical protein
MLELDSELLEQLGFSYRVEHLAQLGPGWESGADYNNRSLDPFLRMAALQEFRRKHKLCIQCGIPSKNVRCPFHEKWNYLNRKIRAKNHKKLGLCISCYAPATHGVRCEYHRNKELEHGRKLRDRWGAKPNTCRSCGGKKEDGIPCVRCRASNKKSYLKNRDAILKRRREKARAKKQNTGTFSTGNSI